MVEGATGYRLPTEAEWEYACRAGMETAYSTVPGITTAQANYGSSVGKTREVGSYDPNPWGLYDMHGNLWELCWDWYDASYYTSEAQTDPTGPSSDSVRAARGGGWYDGARYLRSAVRVGSDPESRNYGLGFRLVRPKV